jgi:hypothetical protein
VNGLHYWRIGPWGHGNGPTKEGHCEKRRVGLECWTLFFLRPSAKVVG